MDLGLLYSNFVMDKKDLTLLSSPDGTAVFRDTDGQTYCTIRPYNHADPDLARDPFSSNRRFFPSGEIELYGTMVVAGPTTDIIYVLVPDHTTCTADDIEPADLQHVIGLRLGAPENLGANLPRDRDQILAVAGRDLTVARHNLAELTRYLDVHAAHLASCARGDDDSIPLMAAETFPRLQGGIGSSLMEWRK